MNICCLPHNSLPTWAVVLGAIDSVDQSSNLLSDVVDGGDNFIAFCQPGSVMGELMHPWEKTKCQ